MQQHNLLFLDYESRAGKRILSFALGQMRSGQAASRVAASSSRAASRPICSIIRRYIRVALPWHKTQHGYQEADPLFLPALQDKRKHILLEDLGIEKSCISRG